MARQGRRSSPAPRTRANRQGRKAAQGPARGRPSSTAGGRRAWARRRPSRAAQASGRVRPIVVQPSDRWRPMRRVAGVPWQEQHSAEPRRVRDEGQAAEAPGPALEDPQVVGSGLRGGKGRLVDFEELEWEPVEHGEEAGTAGDHETAGDDETAR